MSVEARRLHPEIVGEIVTDLLVQHFGEFVDLAFTARMEARLDEVARGERAPVPLLREFYDPLAARVAEKRQELHRRDFTTEPSDEVCSQGHPMVIRLGRNGRFLACSLYPEHKETRPLPGEEGEAMPGEGTPCPRCGEGVLTTRRGRFGPFLGCSRYPACDFIQASGPKPPEPLPFDVTCPKCGEGQLAARRARRTGNVFWGCSRYPACDFTTNFRPLGALHDADDGPAARKGEGTICLRCGAALDLPSDADETAIVGSRLSGGPPDPSALLPRRSAGTGRPRRAATRRSRGATSQAPGSGRARRSAPAA